LLFAFKFSIFLHLFSFLNIFYFFTLVLKIVKAIEQELIIFRYEKFLSGLDHLQYQTFIEQRQDLGLPADALSKSFNFFSNHCKANKTAVSQTYSVRLKEASGLNLPADTEKNLHTLVI